MDVTFSNLTFGVTGPFEVTQSPETEKGSQFPIGCKEIVLPRVAWAADENFPPDRRFDHFSVYLRWPIQRPQKTTNRELVV